MKRSSWLVLAFAGAWFAWFAHAGLRAGLLPDDLMNVHYAWRTPVWRLALFSILPFGGEERALGMLALRGLYEAFGLNAAALHGFCFLLLAANLALAWRIFHLLAGSATAAAATLLFAYNAYLNDLYLSAGTIFDLLCFFCVALALVFHFERRGGLLTLASLQLLALASKELAVALPLGLALYQWLYEEKRRWRGPLLCAALAAAFLAGKILAPGAMAANPAYQLNLRPAALVENAARYLGQATYLGPRLEPVHAFWLIYAVGVVAFLLKWRELRWGLLFSLASALPVLAIPARSLYAMYLPWLGAALVAASLPGRAAEWIACRRRWTRIALFAALAAALIPAHRDIQPHALKWYRLLEWQGRVPDEQLRPLFPAIPAQARIYFAADPYDREDWLLTFWFQLRYRDPSLVVARHKRGDAAEAGDYARVLLTRTSAARLPVASPANPAP